MIFAPRASVAGSCALLAIGALACENLLGLGEYQVTSAGDADALDEASAADADAPDASDASCKAPSNGLLVHFTMDSNSVIGNGLFLADSSGNGKNGTLSGFPNMPVTPPGILGQALQFPTSTLGDVEVPGLALDSSPGGVNTVSLWFYDSYAPDGSVNAVVSFFPSGGDNLWLTGQGPSAVNLCFNTKTNDCWGFAGGTLLGNWVHAVAMFANGPISKSRLFLNGQPVTATCVFGGCMNDVSAMSSVELGGFAPFAFEGLLDEVRIYNRGLTSDEIAALYNLCP